MEIDYVESVLPSYLKLKNKLYQSAIHLNTRSLLNKEDDISLLLSQFSFRFRIVMLTETWCNDTSSTLELSGYKGFF